MNPLGEDPDDDNHFARLAVGRERRRYWSNLLKRWADRTPLRERSWFRISKLLDHWVQVSDPKLGLDGVKASELLSRATLRGEFEREDRIPERRRSKIACLTSSPLLNGFRLPKEAADSREWNNLLDCCWLPRADCFAWFAKHDIAPPTSWGLDAGDSTPSSATRVASTPKPKRGPKYKYDWGEVQLFVECELDNYGDFERPEFAEDGWRSQADLEKRVLEHIKKLEGKEPAPSTVRSHVGRMVAAWRAKGRR
jgi:hypothetical protein